MIDCLGSKGGNMRLWLVVVCATGVVGLVGGEPPRRYKDKYLQRVEEDPNSNSPDNTEESSEDPTPYPPSGYRPSQQFLLPTENRALLEPPTSSDSSNENTTDSSEDTTTKEEPQSSQLNEAKVNLNPDDVEEVVNTGIDKPREQPETETQQGVYYVILPTGQLQRRQYLAKVIDLRRMDYQYAQYANVEPISGPIYALNPSSQFLQVVAE